MGNGGRMYSLLLWALLMLILLLLVVLLLLLLALILWLWLSWYGGARSRGRSSYRL